MELVEGEDLAERLGRGPLPLDEALEVGRQIAAALDAAHGGGVIHRDLKPANIKLTPDGKVKVLDFGLAKALDPAGASADAINASLSQTLTVAGTQAGVLLGTAGYMSPEQARGKPVDRRTDLWSLGCVLYECLTGLQLFRGETISDSLAAILRQDPDWSALPEKTPPPVRRLLLRLLRRDPGKRIQDAGDVRLELEEALQGPEGEVDPGVVKEPAASGSRALAAVAAIVALAVGGAIGWLVASPQASPGDVAQATRFTVPLPPGTGLGLTIFGSPIALSPDGRSLVFQADAGEGLGTTFLGGLTVQGTQLFLRDLGSFETVAVPHTEGATTPFFSPDGKWLGFWAEGELRKTQLSGGRPITILRDLPSVAGAFWADDDTIYFGGGLGKGILRVPAGGGAVEVITELDVTAGEIIHADPYPLPGGRVLFSASGGDAQVHVASGPGERRHLLDGGSARLLPSGDLLFSEEDSLRVAAFDTETARLVGGALPLVDGVAFESLGGMQSAALAVSRGGTLAYALRPEEPTTALTWIGFDGTSEVRDVSPAGQHNHLRVSPDGSRLVTTLGHDGIWVTDIESGVAQPVWQEGAAYQARWSPDGSKIVFKLNGDLAVAPAGGGDEPELLLDRDGYLTAFSWSAAGDLAIVEGLGRGSDILILEADGSVRDFRATEATETNPEISPDGRWMAYVSDITGTPEVYIAAFDGGEEQCTVTRGGGYTPAWSADSRRLFLAREGDLWVADLSGESCRTGNERRVVDGFEMPMTFHQRHWDLLPDDEGIVLADSSARRANKAREIHVVLDGLQDIGLAATGD
jgi:serine/threonine-protein kinase